MDVDMNNIITMTDAYKLMLIHWPQYPPKSQRASAYMESRGGSIRNSIS